jgi:hypothetical protein
VVVPLLGKILAWLLNNRLQHSWINGLCGIPLHVWSTQSQMIFHEKVVN